MEQTKKKRMVIALGGNALGSTLEEQMSAVKHTSVSIANLIVLILLVIISDAISFNVLLEPTDFTLKVLSVIKCSNILLQYIILIKMS